LGRFRGLQWFFFVPTCHFDSEQFQGSSQNLLDLQNLAVKDAGRLNGSLARVWLGQALHTLQDFYAHSNWVELNGERINTEITTLQDPPDVITCPDDPSILGGAGLVNLTTGYYPIIDILFGGCVSVPPGKCAHGGVKDIGCIGINKDEPQPYRPLHAMARRVATQHTRLFVEQLITRLQRRTTDNPDPLRAIRALMGVTRTSLAFVIDDSGSMENDIAEVRTHVRRWIDGLPKGSKPDEFLLVRFDDRITPPFVTNSASELLSAVDQIIPGCCGTVTTCPEPVYGALIKAAEACEPDSAELLYTDSFFATDSALVPTFNALIKQKRIKFSPFRFPDDCPRGPSFPNEGVDEDNRQSLQRLAEESGGQFFQLSQPSDLGKIGDFLALLTSRDFVTISRAHGTLDSSGRDFAVPVDSTVSRILFFVNVDSKGPISLVRPSGATVLPTDPDVSFAEFSSGTAITVETPQRGTWQLSVSGSGSFTMVAKAKSPLELFLFEFVELDNNVHTAFAPISGGPVVGATSTGRATLTGPFGTAQFRLVNEAGETLRAINLVQGNPNAAADQFVGSFSLPHRPFRVVVSGQDESGNTYQRLFPTLFKAQSVQVTLDPATANVHVPINATTSFRFNVRNLGNAGSFRIQATTDTGFVRRISRELLTLDKGEAASFDVDLVIPAGTAEGSKVLLIASATNTVNSTVTNSASAEPVAFASANLHPIANAGRDELVIIGSPVRLDGSRSSDPDNGPGPLSFVWAQVAGPEVTLSKRTTPRPTFIPRAAGHYVFALVVNDGKADSFPDEVRITVQSTTPTPTPTPRPGPITITVNTSPAGLSYAVDGTTYTVAKSFSWVAGSTHMLSTTSPQNSGRQQYIWERWSDDGPISHAIAPTTPTAYTAFFREQ
jgi:hypothetical protein